MNKILSLCFCLFLLVPAWAQQLQTPPASPPSILQQQVGYANIKIEYARPGIKGRSIFGDLIPFGEVWRAGANNCTKIHFDQSVTIGGKSIGPGTWALFLIPGEAEWTWILNTDTTLWGTRGYKQALDVVRVKTKSNRLSERVETMEFRWMNLQDGRADLALEWDYTRVVLPIAVSTDAEVMQRIKDVLATNPTGTDYYRAARYYLDHGKDLKQAQKWMEKRVELDGNQFGILRYKAIIEYKLGEIKKANETMRLSLQLAKEAGNDHYVRMNAQSLKDWNKEATSMSATEVLAKSLQYHDPDTSWGQKKLDWHFYESRPNNSFRLSHMTFNPLADHFTLSQEVGKHTLYREVQAGVCKSKIDGKEDAPKALLDRFRMDCDRNTMYRNYYTYLWGMPMKLKDPGTHIAEKVHLRDFFGEQLLELKVTYDPSVGNDIWYFYFDPQSYALKGYRFYHDEAANDGEYILFDGEVATDGMRIPAKRTWYTHKDNRILGTDELVLKEE